MAQWFMTTIGSWMGGVVLMVIGMMIWSSKSRAWKAAAVAVFALAAGLVTLKEYSETFGASAGLEASYYQGIIERTRDEVMYFEKVKREQDETVRAIKGLPPIARSASERTELNSLREAAALRSDVARIGIAVLENTSRDAIHKKVEEEKQAEAAKGKASLWNYALLGEAIVLLGAVLTMLAFIGLGIKKSWEKSSPRENKD